LNISLIVDCRREELKQIRDRLSADLEAAKVDGLQRDQIILAVDEACANAIIHGNSEDESRQIRVEAWLDGDVLSVRVFDVGSFKINPDYLRRDIDYYVSNELKGGLGLRLIHMIMDEVQFGTLDDMYVCTMRKKVEFSE
jgi:serine/threonine-protein kinase RsbW